MIIAIGTKRHRLAFRKEINFKVGVWSIGDRNGALVVSLLSWANVGALGLLYGSESLYNDEPAKW